MNIQQYIASGIIETYVLGLALPEEASQLERLLPFYPELQAAISDFGFQVELFAIQNEVPPPTGTFSRIQDRLRELPAVKNPVRPAGRASEDKKENEYVPVRESSTHIRVHKYWRVAFIVVFILSKLLLFGFIYFLLQYRHAERDLRALKLQEQTTNKANLSPDPQDGEK
ncbi:MAG TPA: hypothetical protein VHD83_24360 [Puia sp.]|nr:hypothetical protein [Puia sp.]